MKIKSLLVQIRPRSFTRWRCLPTLGPLLDDFLRWMHAQHYSDSTLDSHLVGLGKVVVWLGRRRIAKLAQLTQKDLQVAHDHFLPNQKKAASVISALKLFLSEHQLVSPGTWPPPSPLEVEVERLGAYLRETRGAAKMTIACRECHLRAFLRFLRFDGNPIALQQLELRRVEAFMRKSAQTNNRSSMQQVVAAVRAYLLKEGHAQGLLSRPLHLQIDTPRVYRGERLPQALPWARIQALIQSIDCSEPMGRRDFTLLYLAAAYGLRSGELVRLTFESIDWRNRALLVRQAKTRPEMFARWTKTLGRLTSTGSRNCQRVVRNFLLLHARDHSGTFIPDQRTFPKPAPVLFPRLVSEAEMSRVLEVAGQLHQKPIRPPTWECCGAR